MIRKSLSSLTAALMTLAVFSGTVSVMNLGVAAPAPQAAIA